MQTSLVDYLDNTIKNSVDYNYQKEDLFFNTRIAAYEDLSSTGNKKYEFYNDIKYRSKWKISKSIISICNYKIIFIYDG